MSRHCGPNKDGGAIAQPCGINRRRTARRLPGFTLIELVVVISIILLLVGLTMSVGLAVRSQSETRQTENVLILLDQAVKQWQIAADRQLSWGYNNIPAGAIYDVEGEDAQGTIPADVQLIQLLERIRTNSAARDILAQIDDDFLQQEEENDVTFLTLVDPWGKRIYLIHPGRVVNPNPPFNDNPLLADLDGTIRTEDEKPLGIALNRALLFLSAGPDGEFGDLSADPGLDAFKQTQDNVYSYKPGLIEQAP